MLEVWVSENLALWKELKGVKRKAEIRARLRLSELQSHGHRVPLSGGDSPIPPHAAAGSEGPGSPKARPESAAYSTPGLLMGGAPSPARGWKAARPAALTDLAAAPGVYRAAV